VNLPYSHIISMLKEKGFLVASWREYQVIKEQM